ncbi:hypothetical protein ACOMHN_045081 [Nucella lapillus]
MQNTSVKLRSTSISTPVTTTTPENDVQNHTMNTDYTDLNSHYNTGFSSSGVREKVTESSFSDNDTAIDGNANTGPENEHTTFRYNNTITQPVTGNNTDGPYPDVDVKLSIHTCSSRPVSVFGKKGKITGLFGDYLNEATGPLLCQWSIHIPDGFQYLHTLLTLPEYPCMYRYRIEAQISEASQPSSEKEARVIFCRQLQNQIFIKSRVYNFVLIDDNKYMAHKNPRFVVEFDSFTEDVRKRLSVRSVTPGSGYITQWGYGGERNHLCVNDAYHELTVSDEHVIMVSFARFDMSELINCPSDSLYLYSVLSPLGANHKVLLARYCGALVIPPLVSEFSLLFHFKTQTNCRNARSGFKAFYSLFHIREKPQMLDGLFNCSTANYDRFRPHLGCNLEYECIAGEDETGQCPFSDFRCNGLVSSGHKCYQYVFWDEHLSSYAAQKECARRDGDLAMVKSQTEWNNLQKMFQYGKQFKAALFGVRTGDFTLPDMYRYMLKWVDNSIAQNIHVLTQEVLMATYHYNFEMCGVLEYRQKFSVKFELCKRDLYTNFICQILVQQAPVTSVDFPVITFPLSVVNRTQHWLLTCPDGHVTHAFLYCESQSRCQHDKKLVEECKVPVDEGGDDDYFVVSMFMCDDGAKTTSYTVVCDYREDCNDGSDETFCVHNTSCAGFLCHNRQCVDNEKRCNLEKDCLDHSDEEMCEEEIVRFRKYSKIRPVVRLPPPVAIDFNKDGEYTQVPLSDYDACLDTHFRCADSFCLPVYVRCNGVKDCTGGEDELKCHLYQCEGFYHCRSSAVCVHADHMCDGWPQCPDHDDEWLCQWTCPPGCRCQGLALECTRSVSLSSFHDVRYLDARGAGMKPQDVPDLRYLVWLSLSSCGINQISELSLPNLRNLDLSNNMITSLRMDVLLSLLNLKRLDFSGNLLSYFVIDDPQIKHSKLYSLDLSWNRFKAFNLNEISVFPEMYFLNISYSKVDMFQHSHDSRTLSLTQIDLRGNPLTSYPQNVFVSLDRLQYVWTGDYRLCCQQSLPKQFYDNGYCISPRIHLSSCKDLLRYGEHRVVLLVVMLMCIVGNLGSLLAKCYMKRKSHLSSTDVQMIHWNLLDLLMGLYVAIIAIADWTYRHRYFSIRHVWTASVVCRVASLLASVSYQATAFLVCCVTVHSLCMACPHRVRFQFSPRSSLLACMLVWTVAVTISVVPLALPEWKFYGHTDTCLAVLSAISEGPGKMYALALQIVLHISLCFLVFAGQGFLCWVSCFNDVPSVSITQRFLQMGEATSTSSQVLLDCVRRLVFCVISLLMHGGVSLPEHVRVAFAILVLPVSAALNPLLHVVGIVMARRRQTTLQRVLQRLQRQLALHKPT